jgi:HYR domain
MLDAARIAVPARIDLRGLHGHGSSANQASGTFTVTVVDTTPPTIEPQPDVIVRQQSADGAVATFHPVVTDIADQDPTLACSQASGTEFGFGETLVTCTAKDDANNVSQPLAFRVIVEKGPLPTKPTLTTGVPHLTNKTSAGFRFAVDEGATAACRLARLSDPGSFTPCSGSKSYTGLREGAYLFTVQATNGIGNVRQATYSWRIDRTSPAAVGRFRAHTSAGSATLRWTKPVDVDYARVKIWRKRAGAPSWSLRARRTTATSFTDRTVKNEVRYRYRIRSIDRAGNTSTASFAAAPRARSCRPSTTPSYARHRSSTGSPCAELPTTTCKSGGTGRRS